MFFAGLPDIPLFAGAPAKKKPTGRQGRVSCE